MYRSNEEFDPQLHIVAYVTENGIQGRGEANGNYGDAQAIRMKAMDAFKHYATRTQEGAKDQVLTDRVVTASPVIKTDPLFSLESNTEVMELLRT